MPTLKTSKQPVSITLSNGDAVTTVTLQSETATVNPSSATIAWDLEELAPGGTWTDGNSLLSATSGTTTSWTPTGVAYMYRVRATASLGSGSTVAARAVRVGNATSTLEWVQTVNKDFVAASSVAAPGTDGGSITVASLPIGTDNADGGAGRGTIVNTNGVGLVLTPAATTAQAIGLTTTTRTATIATIDWDDLGLDSTDEDQEALILVQIAAFAPADNSAFLQIGWELASDGISTGSAGRGELFGPGRSGATQQFHECSQDQSGASGSIVAPSSPPSASSARVLMLRLNGKNGACFYWSNTVGDFTTTDPFTVFTKYSSGTSRQRSYAPTGESRFIIALSSPSVASPTAATIQAIRVLKRTSVLS